jgi:hypothetical protein
LSQTIEARTRSCEVDPIKSHPGEELPPGTFRNYAGFLIKDPTKEIEVDEQAVEEETTKLRSRMVIGCFVGRKPTALEFEA